jgi:hypothetical protein
MQALLSLLQSVPDVVWSGIVASVLTLSGVLLSNRSNTHRLRIQLQHDAAEKAKERTATLRRETYLRAAEELVRLNAYFAGLPQVDISKINPSEWMQGFFTTAARLQLVAEPKTALLVNKLAAAYAELVFTVMTAIRPVADAKSDIGIADALYDKSQAEVNRLLAEITKQRESGQPNQEVVSALRQSFDFQQSQAAKFAADRSAAWTRFNAASALFQKTLLIEVRDLGMKQIPVMVEIRRDLGLTGDLSEIEAFMREQWKKMETKFNALLASLEDA